MFIKSVYKNINFFLLKAGILGFLAILLLNIPVFSASAESSPLLITEINYAGSSMPNGCKTNNSSQRCAFDKWLEITNISSQSVNLSGWSLQFRQSADANNNVVLPATLLPAGETFLVAYYEINFFSALQASGAIPNYYSGKIRNISNMDNKTVTIALKDNFGQMVQSVFLSPADISAFELEMQAGAKHSIELTSNGSWAVSQQAFFAQNFGTPAPLFFLNPAPPQADAQTAPFLQPEFNFSPNFSPIYIDIIIEDVPVVAHAGVAFEVAARSSIIEIPQVNSFQSAIIASPQTQANPVLTPTFSSLPVAVIPRMLPLPLRLVTVSSYFWHINDFIAITYSHSLPYLLFMGLAMAVETVRSKSQVSLGLAQFSLQN